MPENESEHPLPPNGNLHPEEVVRQADEMKHATARRRKDLRGNMLRSVVTEPLLSRVQTSPTSHHDVIIALNELYRDGLLAALQIVREKAKDWQVPFSNVSHYVFACLTGEQILTLARWTQEQLDTAARDGHEVRAANTIHRIWEDTDIHASLTKSLTTIKADAAQRSFRALGDGITWAVLDSGIQGSHDHFQYSAPEAGGINNLQVQKPVRHMDFTALGRQKARDKARQQTDPDTLASLVTGEFDKRDDRSFDSSETALTDNMGHGTHVAGIIAGYWESKDPNGEMVGGVEERNEADDKHPFRRRERLKSISGVAPLARVVSMKVIADETVPEPGPVQTMGQGKVSWVLLAIDQIQQWNQHGKRLLVQGVNMSLGYPFDPRWFACGESPLCVEVNRLVKSGVAVVVSAGNDGFSTYLTQNARSEQQYRSLSITDPGNAELAITVGSTHKEMPHRYGVSYFSSRGPTGDGRLKPDLLAPGERIISCAAGQEVAKFAGVAGDPAAPELKYVEQTGTSMAAPHVSGALAAFMSVRTEFIGQPERLKEIFMATAIDLRRERTFQGAGLIDLMRAIQSV